MTYTDRSSIQTLRRFTYMVRAVKMQMTPSGRYENYSWGATVVSKLNNSDAPGGPTDPGNSTIGDGTGFTAASTKALRTSPTLFSDNAIPTKTQVDPLDDLGL
jgi:hypothetical protein